MKTGLKLNKSQLFALYEKSNDRIKQDLRSEFGQEYFREEKVKPEISPEVCNVSSTNSEVQKNKKKAKLFDWAAIMDFTTIPRMLGYAYLICLILRKI